MMKNWTLNGCYVENKPQQLMAQIIEGLPDLKFRSADGLHHLYLELLGLTIEMAEAEREEARGAKRGVLTRYINSLKNRKKRDLPDEQIQMLTIIYDMILAADGMGLLPGFGFGNKWGDRIAGNPERQSIYDITPTKPKERKKEDSTMEEIKRSELVKAAKELNEILGLDPQIDVKAKPAELKEKLIEAMDLLTEDDELTETTEIILAGLRDENTEEEKEWQEPPVEEEHVEKKIEPVKTGKNKQGVPKREGSLSEFVDKLMEANTPYDELVEKAIAEAKARTSKSMTTPGAVKAHIKFRQKRGYKPALQYNVL